MNMLNDRKSEDIPDGFEPLVGIDVVVEKLGVPKKTIYQWCYQSRVTGFPYYRVGRWSKFRLSEIEQWLRKYRFSIS
jgi:predicted DNA-binding transcriptional regulator AlpA